MAQNALLSKHDTLHCLDIRDGEYGRGLCVREAAKKGQALLIVPFSALLHVGTASVFLAKELLPKPQRPSHESHWQHGARKSTNTATTSSKLPLTSVQALTLILAQWRASHRIHSRAAHTFSSLDGFLNSYPESYKSMPLQWQQFVDQTSENDGAGESQRKMADSLQSALQQLPPGVAGLVDDVRKRYMRDRDTLFLLRKERRDLFDDKAALEAVIEQDLVWAWISVNTRCVYLPLGLKPHADNFTLAPLLDMANHTFDEDKECKVEWLPARALQLAAARDGLKEGDQLFISYGPHSNGFLLAEYGFTMPYAAPSGEIGRWHGNPFCEIKVDHMIDRLVASQGKQGQAKKALLVEMGYWNDYTVHPHPAPVHPSYRLIVALRLLAIASTANDEIQQWTASVQGRSHSLGKANDEAVCELLRSMCNEVIVEGRRATSKLSDLLQAQDPDERTNNGTEWNAGDVLLAARSVSQLHEEEMAIAIDLLKAIDDRTIDWL
jgi:hypothetical protein